MAERLIQFAIPIILIRFLDQEQYGHFRIFWMLINTVMLFAPLGLPQSLMFFLPRQQGGKRSVFVHQTLLVLFLTGLLGAALLGPWSPLTPSSIQGTAVDSILPPLFVVLWAVAIVLDVLPSAMQDIKNQVRIILFLALLRPLLVIGSTVFTEDLRWVIIALLVFVCIKMLLLFYYVIKNFSITSPSISPASLRQQLNYSIPFGLSTGLYNLRAQAEQWVVALMFKAESFAVFSTAALFIPLVGVLRRPVKQVIQPMMSKAHANGDVERLLQLNRRGNLVVSVILLPVLAYMFCFASQIVIVLFTKEYEESVSILRIYTVGMIRMSIEVASILVIFSQGRFVMKVAGLLSLLSVAGSYLGAHLLGLNGAALGSVVSLYIGAVLNFQRAAMLVGKPVRHLQDWRSLFLILIGSILAATIAWVVVFIAIPNGAAIVQLIIGLAITCLIYFIYLTKTGHGWLLPVAIGRRKWEDGPK